MTNNAIIIEKLSDEDGGVNILNGTTDPTADLGEDGQIYLKYQVMSLSDYFTFTNATLQPDGVTLVFSSEGGSLTTKFSRKTFVAEVSNLPAVPYGPSGHGYELLYGNSSAQYWLKSSIVNSFAGNTNGLYCNYNYGTVELTNYYNGDRPSNQVCGGVTFKLISVDNVALGDTITAVYLKVNGAWQALIGSDIDDVNT